METNGDEIEPSIRKKKGAFDDSDEDENSRKDSVPKSKKDKGKPSAFDDSDDEEN